MSRIQIIFIAVALVALASCGGKSKEKELRSKNYVSDLALVFKSEEVQKLQLRLDSFNKSTNVDVVVLTRNDMSNEDSILVFGRRGITGYQGLSHANNWIYIYLFPSERKLHIIKGYGFEWSISLEEIDTVVDHSLEYFSKEKYFDGVSFCVTKIIELNRNMQWDLCNADSNFCVDSLAVAEIIKKDINQIQFTTPSHSDPITLLTTPNLVPLLNAIDPSHIKFLYFLKSRGTATSPNGKLVGVD